jgi:hypothetical protein
MAFMKIKSSRVRERAANGMYDFPLHSLVGVKHLLSN